MANQRDVSGSGTKRRDEAQGGGTTSQHAPGAGSKRGPDTSLVEWIIAGLGGAVVLATIAFLLWHAATRHTDAMPRVVVRVDSIVAYGGGYAVEFEARNLGEATAAAVTVEGELRSDTGSVERAQASLAYVPRGSARRGGLVFTRDPRRYRLSVRALGYARP